MDRLIPIGVLIVLFAQLAGLWQVRVRERIASDEEVESVDLLPREDQSTTPRSKAWRRAKSQLRKANRTLEQVVDAKGIIRKQERWGDFVEPVAEIEFAQFSEPFSIHLKWLEPHKGREVLFQAGSNRHRLTVLESTPLGKLAPTVTLPIDHQMAKQVSRHPITEFSLEFIRTEMRRYIGRGERNPDSQIEIDPDCDLDGVACFHVRITHPSGTSQAPKQYHRVDMYFRDGDAFPIRWEKYGWPQTPEEDPPLQEYFQLEAIELNTGLTREYFRSENPEFGFGSIQIPFD